MKKPIVTIALSVCIAFPVAAYAFGFGSLPGIGGGGASSGTDLSASQDQLVKSYVSGSKLVLVSQYEMANAVGLKDKAAAYKATADALSTGATKDNLENADKAMSDSSKAVADALAKNPTMDAEGKKHFALGLASLAGGIISYSGMTKDASNFSSGISSASPMELMKLSSAMYIVKSLPSNLKNLISSLNNAVSFAKSHDIPVPSDATKALSAI